MRLTWILVPICFFATTITTAPAKSQDPQKSTKSNTDTSARDTSHEPLVYESVRGSMHFENNGMSSLTISSRIHVQNQAGLQSVSQLVFSYGSTNDNLEIRYVRTVKPDGRIVVAGPDAIQDLSAPISQQAPVYSDMRQRHVIVPALSVGDIVEYEIHSTTLQPLTPGQFFQTWNFVSDVVCLDERVEMSIPRDRLVKIKGPQGLDPAITVEGDRRVYRWKTSNLAHTPASESPPQTKPERAAESPEVSAPRQILISSFENWAQVGEWYARLEKDRKIPTPGLHVKADEIVRGALSDLEKAQAIYNFVTRNIRYVGISFGIGRYQPHAASEVLANQYGDCKDMSVLLNALLAAEGIQSSTALIHLGNDIDPDVPSPLQFDHAISVVTIAGRQYWLDATASVAPFGFLLPPLRGKSSLVVMIENASELKKTPENLPWEPFYKVNVQATAEDAMVDAHLTFETRSDFEVILRSMVIQYPAEQLVDLLNQGAKESVPSSPAHFDSLKTSDPMDTSSPFHWEAHIRGPLSQNGEHIFSPLILLDSSEVNWVLPNVPQNRTYTSSKSPIQLGEPRQFILRLKLTMPAEIVATNLHPAHVASDFANFETSATFENQILNVEWRLQITKSEISSAQFSDYSAFRNSVLGSLQPFEIKHMSFSELPPDRALPMAESAVKDTEARMRNTTLNNVTLDEVKDVPEIAMLWDSIGWLKFKTGDFLTAEKYVQAAWDLTEQAAFADHLGQIYQKEGRKLDAIRAYELSLTCLHADQETKKRLVQLLGTAIGVDDRVRLRSGDLANRRTAKFKNQSSIKGSAEFWVLVVPGPRIESIQFISGDEQMKIFSNQIQASQFKQTFPKSTEIKILRRGIISCSSVLSECFFVLIPSENVQP